jgi:hypothetical protein
MPNFLRPLLAREELVRKNGLYLASDQVELALVETSVTR